ncbi:hypothetical protein F2Q68_00010152 [Brassica cretica]|uniref:Zinc/iron-chelating domain-containing protein n=1 Tax=Brassica cretica TaxID=69181 RepID=A0A8S9L5B4_BRACR|nr:hypothetical protein F2Q68_00010152 [Brassica cretica]
MRAHLPYNVEKFRFREGGIGGVCQVGCCIYSGLLFMGAFGSIPRIFFPFYLSHAGDNTSFMVLHLYLASSLYMPPSGSMPLLMVEIAVEVVPIARKLLYKLVVRIAKECIDLTANEQTWQCIESCGACCKLVKGFAFATPDEIFDDPDDVELYRSMIGDDGWCINYDKATRKCSIYPDRPYFCRVEPEVFKTFYGIEEKKFNKEACSCCIDTIKTIPLRRYMAQIPKN